MHVREMVARDPHLLSLDLDRNVKSVVGWLGGVGLTGAARRNLLSSCPAILHQDVGQLQLKYRFLKEAMHGDLQVASLAA